MFNDSCEISDDEILLRVVHPSMVHEDEMTGRKRPNSAVFPVSKKDTEISVYIGSVVISSGREHADLVKGRKYLAGIKVADIRKHNLDVHHDKIGDIAHANIIDKAKSRTRAECKSIGRALALSAFWVVPPP